MDVEQRMISGEALGRRGQRRESRAAHVFEVARPQKGDRREERYRLLWSDRKAVGAQERREVDERSHS